MARPRQQRPASGPPAAPLFIAYYRVSTDQQGRSGLGLAAQKAAVAQLVERQGGIVGAEFEEVESGKRSDRPQLAAALAACRARRGTLIIAKLDRLARNTHFLLTTMNGLGDAGVLFCDLPQIPAGPMGKFFLTLMAAVAELEAGLISQRTKAALAAAKARGKKLGGPNLRPGDARIAALGRASSSARATATARDIMPYVLAAQAAGAKSLRQIANALEARGVRTPAGKQNWHVSQVRMLLLRSSKNTA